MRILFRKIHLWLSVPFGLIISLICFSGAMLVFEDEIYELTQSECYFVKSVESVAIPMDELLDKIVGILPDSVSITGVNISSDPKRTYQVNLSKPRRSSIYVDPYTGEITGKSERSGFFMCMFRLHRWLLDSIDPDGGVFVGKLVVGISTLLFVVVLISGLIVWWPRTRIALKNRLKISSCKGWRRFWYDLHVTGGIYAFGFLLVMALTGLTWSFPWYRTAFYKVFGVEVQQLAHGKEQKGNSPKKNTAKKEIGINDLVKDSFEKNGSRKGHFRKEDSQSKGSQRNDLQGANLEISSSQRSKLSTFAYWEEVYDKLCRQNPNHKQISVSSGLATVSFNHLGNQRAADRYAFNAENGEFTETSLYQHQDKAGKIRGWIYSVHVGNWGGTLTRILAFIAALVGAVLPLTGYYLWIKKLIHKRKRITSNILSSAQTEKIA